MDLFTPILPQAQLHPNFVRVCVPNRGSERALVQGWADGFPDRDKKLVREFQSTFNSSFWEVYLHALFREYGFKMDWKKASPDYALSTSWGDIAVEAVTANAAAGSTPEWDKPTILTEKVAKKEFWALNREAIIRLANALLSKLRMYRQAYKDMAHVAGKPFVIAVAPFEQPDFQYQYDRPMRALLYDDYVDEEAYFKDRAKYPDGPPSVRLRSIEKDNGATIDLGIFCDESWAEVSAVLFSCVATWGKAVAMSTEPRPGFVITSWGTDASGRSEMRQFPVGTPSETIFDGLQVFHNPFAKRPLPLDAFRRAGVVQHFVDSGMWVMENYDNCLQFRRTQVLGTFSDAGVAVAEPPAADGPA